jgi:hypothetical protein
LLTPTADYDRFIVSLQVADFPSFLVMDGNFGPSTVEDFQQDP